MIPGMVGRLRLADIRISFCIHDICFFHHLLVMRLYQLEGIEDIDCITQNAGNDNITHIQLKYSKNKQDASFLPDVLKNFLEAYLLDQNRSFKLVYDFPVAQGNLQKLFYENFDCDAHTYWKSVVSKIQEEQNLWNWSAYDYDQFLSRLSFERIEKASLAVQI